MRVDSRESPRFALRIAGPSKWMLVIFFWILVNRVHTRCIVKTSGFTRGVCKNRGSYIKFKGFLVEFLENRRA